MADIFISYAREDRERAKVLAKALEDHGSTVWWDPEIPPGKSFDQVIEKALEEAKCIVVLWSKESVVSDWVKEEAEEAKRRQILVPVLIAEVNPPIGFKRVQAADLTDWHGDQTHAGFTRLLVAIADLLRPSVTEETLEPDSDISGTETEADSEPILKSASVNVPKPSLRKRFAIGFGVGILILLAIGIFRLNFTVEPETRSKPSTKKLIASHFDVNQEGWSPFEAGGFNWYDNQNNDSTFGGHLEATDGSRSPWYFRADPAKYSGDMRQFYGGELSYHFRWWANRVSDCIFKGKHHHYYDDRFGGWWKPDVELEGSNGVKLGYFFPKNSPDEYVGGLLRYNTWKKYVVPISENKETADGYGWIKWCDAPPCYERATEADIKNVLQDLKALMIRGEYCFGAGDRGLLDEVKLTASDSD